MILPINRVYGNSCIFCGQVVPFNKEATDSEYVILKDGNKIIASRRFHHSCYIKNAKESKRRKAK